MAKKGFKKQKAGSQTSKQRKSRPQGSSGGGAPSSSTRSSGALGGFRKGLQLIAGTSKKKGPKTAVEKLFDIVLWIAVVAAGFFFVSKQCT